jgi:hypothetical protein
VLSRHKLPPCSSVSLVVVAANVGSADRERGSKKVLPVPASLRIKKESLAIPITPGHNQKASVALAYKKRESRSAQ